MTTPRVLVLDCGSVTNSDATACLPALAAIMGIEPEDAKRGMSAAWALSRSNSNMDAIRFWSTALAEAGRPLGSDDPLTPDDAATVDACERHIAETLRVSYEDTLATAKRLKTQGVTVGIISNHITSPPWFQECAASAGLYELASDPSLVVVSQEVEVAKPDARIYEIFFDRLRHREPDVQLAELVFVDDKEKNVVAAQALGWQGICYNATTAATGELARGLAALGMGAVAGTTAE
jgi:FMN phosphatase YigB (HAD superfamily)